jgi:arsenate reductase
MVGEWVLWFDARCTASRRALELLRARGVEPTLRRFLEEPPTEQELAGLIAKLGVPVRSVARQDADEYQALRLSHRTSDEALLRAVAQHPRILQRPILAGACAALVARPPERVLELVGTSGPGLRRRVVDNPG